MIAENDLNQRAAQRREYIQAVRNSFPDTPSKRNFEHTLPRYLEETPLEPPAVTGFWKLRVLLSVMLFAAFVLCERTSSPIFTFDAAQITKMIEENSFSANAPQDLLKSLNNFVAELTKK